MLGLLTSFNQFKDNPRVQGMTNAVVPIVGVMMGVLTWSFLKKGKEWVRLEEWQYSTNWKFNLYCRASNTPRYCHWSVVGGCFSFTRKE